MNQAGTGVKEAQQEKQKPWQSQQIEELCQQTENPDIEVSIQCSENDDDENQSSEGLKAYSDNDEDHNKVEDDEDYSYIFPPCQSFEIPPKEQQEMIFGQLRSILISTQENLGSYCLLDQKQFGLCKYWSAEANKRIKEQKQIMQMEKPKFRGRRAITHKSTKNILESDERTFDLTKLVYQLTVLQVINDDYAVIQMSDQLKQVVEERNKQTVRILIGLEKYENIPYDIKQAYWVLREKNPHQDRDYYLQLK